MMKVIADWERFMREERVKFQLVRLKTCPVYSTAGVVFGSGKEAVINGTVILFSSSTGKYKCSLCKVEITNAGVSHVALRKSSCSISWSTNFYYKTKAPLVLIKFVFLRSAQIYSEKSFRKQKMFFCINMLVFSSLFPEAQPFVHLSCLLCCTKPFPGTQTALSQTGSRLE